MSIELKKQLTTSGIIERLGSTICELPSKHQMAGTTSTQMERLFIKIGMLGAETFSKVFASLKHLITNFSTSTYTEKESTLKATATQEIFAMALRVFKQMMASTLTSIFKGAPCMEKNFTISMFIIKDMPARAIKADGFTSTQREKRRIRSGTETLSRFTTASHA